MSFWGYLRGFIPWIIFAFFPVSVWQWGALAALVSGLLVFGRQRSVGVPIDALILEIGNVVYFIGVAVLAFAAPHTPVRSYVVALSFVWLALTAWGSLAIGRPFTLGIAKQTTRPELWGRPEFRHVTVVIAAVWALAFTLTALGTGLLEAIHAGPVPDVVVEIVGVAVPAVFTAYYPKIMQARYAARAAT